MKLGHSIQFDRAEVEAAVRRLAAERAAERGVSVPNVARGDADRAMRVYVSIGTNPVGEQGEAMIDSVVVTWEG